MNVCVLCQADGVLEAAGCWYCKDHLYDGLLEVAAYVDRVDGTDFVDILEDAVYDGGDPEPAARPYWPPPTV